jgi:tRNA-specific 2-thiouridylase
MSGGVDSSVTAALLAAAGYDVVGITLQLYDHGEAIGNANSCCAGRDITDARGVAAHLGISHYVLDYESRFHEAVIDDFADSYLAGYTPIPCVHCNQTVKFQDLLACARDLGAAALATGHYVRRIAGSDGPELHRAAELARDQSYFLFATTTAQLAYLRFPLADVPKAEVRAEAARLALPVAEKPDSQDICFVPEGDYAGLVERLRPGALDPGPIELADGTKIGHHTGIIGFTVGQRKGLRVAWSEPLYVLRIEPARQAVVVGPKAALEQTALTLFETNWLAAPGADQTLTVKLRSTHPGASGTACALFGGRCDITLDVPAGAIAPGQAAVLYDGSKMLGGGWIERPVLTAHAPNRIALHPGAAE